MKWFLMIFVLLIFACGNAVYILNTNRTAGDDGDSLYSESFTRGKSFLSAVLN